MRAGMPGCTCTASDVSSSATISRSAVSPSSIRGVPRETTPSLVWGTRSTCAPIGERTSNSRPGAESPGCVARTAARACASRCRVVSSSCAAEETDLAPVYDKRVFTTEQLLEDVLASLNSSELAQRRFREIARVAGLVFVGYPGAPKSMKQLQASSSLFYEVFRKYDAGNLLLSQAEREVLSQELDIARLRDSLERMAGQRIEAVELRHPSPLSLPLMVERFREQLSTEKLGERLERIVRDATRALEAAPTAKTRPA